MDNYEKFNSYYRNIKLQKAFDFVKDKDILEKAKKRQIGEIVTRKDGLKYKKVKDTGNGWNDWELVKEDKGKKEEVSSKEEKEISPAILKKYAKDATDEQLKGAVKEGNDTEKKVAEKELEDRGVESKEEDDKNDLGDLESNAKKLEELSIKMEERFNAVDLDGYNKISEQMTELMHKQAELMKDKNKVEEFKNKKDDKDKKEEGLNKRIRKLASDEDDKIKEALNRFEGKGEKLGLSEEQQAILSDYTEDGYWKLNKALRNGEDDEFFKEQKDILNEVIDNIDDELKFKGKVYRGLGIKEEDIPTVLEKYINAKEGIEFKAFTSSSIDKKVVDDTFRGNVVFEIESKTGKQISDFSASPEESEVLFKAGTKFKLKGKPKILKGKPKILKGKPSPFDSEEKILRVTMKLVEV